MVPPTLSHRQLNRTLLARQHLVERVSTGGLQTVEQLVGIQAQEPQVPYITLWARLVDFNPAELATDLVYRRVVRAQLHRGTIHLVSARDCLAWAPLMAPMLAGIFNSTAWGKQLSPEQRHEIVNAAREILAGEALTRAALGRRLARRWPDLPPDAMAQAATFSLPLVQVPPRGVWGQKGQATWVLLESWLNQPPGPPTDEKLDAFVLAYLAAFGPASTADVRNWSRLTNLRAVIDRLGPRLRTYRDPTGRVLYDPVDAPIAEEDTPTPPRFLGEYDNVLLGHDDRSRIVPSGSPPDDPPGSGGPLGSYLLDGMLHGRWRITNDGAGAVLHIQPTSRVGTAAADALTTEGARLLAFTHSDRDHDVRLLPVR